MDDELMDVLPAQHHHSTFRVSILFGKCEMAALKELAQEHPCRSGSYVIIVVTLVSSAATFAKRAGCMFVIREAYKTCYPWPRYIALELFKH